MYVILEIITSNHFIKDGECPVTGTDTGHNTQSTVFKRYSNKEYLDSSEAFSALSKIKKKGIFIVGVQNIKKNGKS